MAANGISTLPTKEARQIAKLELAQTKRQQVGTPGYRELNNYNTALLPAIYSGNDVVPQNPELVPGRPWQAGGPAPTNFNSILTEGSETIITEGVANIISE